MNRLKINLFGKFSVFCGHRPLDGFEAKKVKELFAFLVVNRNRSHTRDKLADLLWENSSQTQSKQYLRQTLWQLKTILDENCHPSNKILSLEAEWIQINPTADLWIDSDKFEKAYLLAVGMRGREFTENIVSALQEAVDLYQGDFLENWYQDWCIFERERLQNMYLVMLDKLMGYCETHQKYEQGIVLGSNILRCDVAQERTYRRLMRLLFLSGDRTGALRQYERCSATLERELSAKPTQHTIELYNQIKTDQLIEDPTNNGHNDKQNQTVVLAEILFQLNHIGRILQTAQQQIEKDIVDVKTIFDK